MFGYILLQKRRPIILPPDVREVHVHGLHCEEIQDPEKDDPAKRNDVQHKGCANDNGQTLSQLPW